MIKNINFKQTINQISYIISTNKSLQQINQVIMINEDNIIVKRELKTFYLPHHVDKNLKHEIELIIKSNKSLTENNIKNETGQLLSIYKHGNDIHEHGKQQNESIV